MQKGDGMELVEHTVCGGCGIDEREGVPISLIGEGEGEDHEWFKEYLCMFCQQRALHLWAKFGGDVIERLLFPDSF